MHEQFWGDDQARLDAPQRLRQHGLMNTTLTDLKPADDAQRQALGGGRAALAAIGDDAAPHVAATHRPRLLAADPDDLPGRACCSCGYGVLSRANATTIAAWGSAERRWRARSVSDPATEPALRRIPALAGADRASHHGDRPMSRRDRFSSTGPDAPSRATAMAQDFSTRARRGLYRSALPRRPPPTPNTGPKADGTVSQWLTQSVALQRRRTRRGRDARELHADQGRQDDAGHARGGVLAGRRRDLGVHRARRRDAGGRAVARRDVHLQDARLRRRDLGREGVARRQDRHFDPGRRDARENAGGVPPPQDRRPANDRVDRPQAPPRPAAAAVRGCATTSSTAARPPSSSPPRFLERLAALNALVRESGETIEGGLFYWDQVAEFDDRAPDARLAPARRNLWRACRFKRSMLEVGVNAGHGALLCLSRQYRSRLARRRHLRARLCRTLRRLSRARVSRPRASLRGDSREVLPRLATHRPELDFDLFHVDGGHTDVLCRADVANCIRLARGGRGKHLVLDDINASWIFDVYCEYVVARPSRDRDPVLRLGGREPQRAGAHPLTDVRDFLAGAAAGADARLPRLVPGRAARALTLFAYEPRRRGARAA